MPIETLDELLIEEIKDLYDAEKQLTKALPKMARAASSPDLKAAFTEHLGQTQADAEGAIMDLMLIAAAQKVEHYEMSGYGSVRAMAETIGNDEVADLL